MSQDAAGLDRLHGIVLPDPVPWWPLAPGWYVLMGVAVVLGLWSARRAWRTWRSNAYRREALKALASASDAAAVASVLRRTALAIAPRKEVAGLSGGSWVDWLDRHAPVKAAESERGQLTNVLYEKPAAREDSERLRAYAHTWIRRHRRAG